MVANRAVDMRRSIDGLCLSVVEQFEKNPQSQTLFVFYNKRYNKVKCLLWDKEGFILIYKRYEKGRFKFPKACESVYTIDHQQLKWLLSGFDFIRLKSRPELHFESYY